VDTATAGVNTKAKKEQGAAAAAAAAEAAAAEAAAATEEEEADAPKKQNKKPAPPPASAWTRDNFRLAGAREDEKTYTEEYRNLMKEDARWRKERGDTKALMKAALEDYGVACMRAEVSAVKCKALFDHRFGFASSATATNAITTTAAGGGGGGKRQNGKRMRGGSSGTDTEDALSGSEEPNENKVRGGHGQGRGGSTTTDTKRPRGGDGVGSSSGESSEEDEDDGRPPARRRGGGGRRSTQKKPELTNEEFDNAVAHLLIKQGVLDAAHTRH
jgi:hypothetical protein